MLTPEQFSLIQPLLPPPSPYLRGRPPLDDRLILEAIFYKITHDLPWYDLPLEFPSHQTVYRRYRRWQRLGLWPPIIQALLFDLEERGAFDISQALATRLYRVRRYFDRIIVSIDPSAPDTWQVATGYFILHELIHLMAPHLKKSLQFPP